MSNAVKFVRSLRSAKQSTDTRIVLVDWEAIQGIAELTGWTIERDAKGRLGTIEVRGNRSEQVTTGKLVALLEEENQPQWDCHVAHMYISTKGELPALVEGGNTGRALYRYFDSHHDAEPVPCTISVSHTLTWENWDTIKKGKDNATMLGMQFNDGNEKLYSSLFSFSCLRVRGKSIKGGDREGRTWRGGVWLANKLPTMFEDAWFANLWNLAIYQNEDKVSLYTLGCTLSELVPAFRDNSIAMLIMAWVDYWGSLSTEGNDEPLKAISDNLQQIASQLSAMYKPVGKASYDIESKYSSIYTLIAASIEGRVLPNIFECDTVPPLGAVEAFQEFK